MNAAEVVERKNNETAYFKFSTFLLNPRQSRVSRRMNVRIVRLFRSTWLVEIFEMMGAPLIGVRTTAMTSDSECLP